MGFSAEIHCLGVNVGRSELFLSSGLSICRCYRSVLVEEHRRVVGLIPWLQRSLKSVIFQVNPTGQGTATIANSRLGFAKVPELKVHPAISTYLSAYQSSQIEFRAGRAIALENRRFQA